MAPTQRMNPTVEPDFIADAFEDNPVVAASEFGSLAEGIMALRHFVIHLQGDGGGACRAWSL
jgi:hypothetical protein